MLREREGLRALLPSAPTSPCPGRGDSCGRGPSVGQAPGASLTVVIALDSELGQW